MGFLSESKKSTTLSIIGVMGYYSKGKSFIVNELYNAGVQLGESNYNEKRLKARTAAGVTTKGISGVFSGYSEGNIDLAELLVLDCAGRNAPARAWSKEDNSSIDQLRRGIEELRSKERLVDDVIIATADSIIYVLDEVLNEDQRAIIHIIDEIFQSRSRTELIIIHNMKRINCQSRAIVESITDEMIRDAFHAQEFKSAGSLSSAPRTQWRSTWPNKINRKPFYIYHYVIFDHNYCKKENKATFAIIADRKFRQTEAKFIRELSPLNYLIDHIGSRIVDYVEPTEDNILYSDDSTFHMLGDQSYNSRIIAKNAEKRLKLKQWQMWEMPSTTTGEYVPNHESFHDATHHFFKVELPGISPSNRIEENEQPPVNQSWVRFKKVAPSETDKSFQFKKFVVEGYRVTDKDRFPSAKSHGYFAIETYVELFFANTSIEFANGMLVITSTQLNFDAFYADRVIVEQSSPDYRISILVATFVLAGTIWYISKSGKPIQNSVSADIVDSHRVAPREKSVAVVSNNNEVVPVPVSLHIGDENESNISSSKDLKYPKSDLFFPAATAIENYIVNAVEITNNEIDQDPGSSCDLVFPDPSTFDEIVNI